VEPAIQGSRLEMGIDIIYLSTSIDDRDGFIGMGFLSEISRRAALALRIIASKNIHIL
jgi:hypothetical protein